MRRVFVLACIVGGCLISLHHRTVAALAVMYPQGWNLVSGPGGSTLVGATGRIYTLQPNDSVYQSFPATTPLNGGWGYWAYFPRGGSLQATPRSRNYALSVNAGEWTMVGNPSAVGVALVGGADDCLVLPDAGDYQSAASIPVGHGAWVRAAQPVTISITGVSDPTAPAVTPTVGPSASPSMVLQPDSPTTFEALGAVALGAGDLPTHSLETERPLTTNQSLAVASYYGIWTSQSSSIVVSEILITGFSRADADENASLLMAALTNDPSHGDQQRPDPGSIGDVAHALTFSYHDETGNHDWYVVIFRRGDVAVAVNVVTDPGIYAIDFVSALARIIDAHLTGSAGTTVTPPLPTAHLLQLSGVGTLRTPTFSAPAGSVQVCLAISDSATETHPGSGVTFALYPARTPSSNMASMVLDSSGCRIMSLTTAGQYYLSLGATGATRWSLTVDID